MRASRILIARRLKLTTAVVLMLVVALAAPMLMHQWRAYESARSAAQAFERLRAGLMAMESVSAERGPTNGALGADAQTAASLRAPLASARAESDRRMALLRTLLSAPACPACSMIRAAVDDAQTRLLAARQRVDRLIAEPKERRDHQAVLDAVNQMIAVIPSFWPAVNASATAVVRGDPDALNCVLVARLSAELREQAGLLGSTFTAALTAQRTLSEAELFAQERAKGRIEELHDLIAGRVDHTGLIEAPYQRVNTLYFGDGLSYIDTVRAMATRPGGTDLTPAQLAARYVPTLRPIVQFRDYVLSLADHEVQRHARDTLLLLIVTASGTGVALYLVVLGAVYFRLRFVQPFVEATDIITAMADGQLDTPVPRGDYRREIRSLFQAILVLKENSIAKRRLERERDLLVHELETVADTDFLTRLLNRRAFQRQAIERLGTPPAPGMKRVLIMFDADRFKHLNDTHGHAAGDLALQTIGRLCSDAWPRPDIAARIGGEEFAVLTDVRDPQDAIDAANALRRGLASTVMVLDDGQRIGVTLSFGIAVAADTGRETLDALLLRADRLLYSAKQGGRNRVVSDSVCPNESLT
jgi:diguanylate cyclase (GGDEF)-like protein